MKKTFIGSVIGTIFVMILTSCACPPPGLDRFIGEWKGISKVEDQKDTLTAIYDKENKCLRIYCISTAVITYLEKSGHLSVNQGGDGEYEKITH